MGYHSDRLSVARNRFEVLGVRGDRNKLASKSTTFDLVLVTFVLRTNPAEPHGNRNRGGHFDPPPLPKRKGRINEIFGLPERPEMRDTRAFGI